MSFLPFEIIPTLQYAAPPAVGAFIGYLTNKIAIKMLFRPLKPWYFLGLRVPMTPGVIPSKRGELANNMGRMVSEHLLTSTEIGNALDQDDVKKQIFKTIETEGERLAAKDLGNLKSLIPEQFNCYYDLGIQYVSYKSIQGISGYIHSEQFEYFLDEQITSFAGELLNNNLSTFVSIDKQKSLFIELENSLTEKIHTFLGSTEFQTVITRFIQNKINEILLKQKTLSDLLSEQTRDIIKSFITSQSKPLLSGVSNLVQDEKIRAQIIDGACQGVENFINSMGPMAAMVHNFIKIETVREKIGEYLDEKESDIITWFQSDEIVEKLHVILEQQTDKLLEQPIVNLLQNVEPEKIENISISLSSYICTQLNDKSFSKELSQSFCIQIEDYLKADPSIGNILSTVVGDESIRDGVSAIKRKCINYLRSEKTESLLKPMVDTLIQGLTNKKIGPLENLLNENMRKSIYNSLQKATLSILKKEIPEVTRALNLQQIVSTKINSLDLLKLESLLLSIMEEQFKYINLFGAVLGFILGCVNLIFIAMS